MAVRPQADRGIRRFAPLAVMPAGAFAVHQLRYWLAFGSHAGAELQATGHSYLHSVVPWIVALLAIAVGVFLGALGRAFGGQSSVARVSISFVGLWLVCALALVAIYTCQEFLEGLFLTGHPGGLIGIFGYGGWWSIPAAMAVGLVLAAIFQAAGWVLKEVAQRYRREIAAKPHRAAPMRPLVDVVLPAPAPLAAGWSGRGPPGRGF